MTKIRNFFVLLILLVIVVVGEEFMWKTAVASPNALEPVSVSAPDHKKRSRCLWLSSPGQCHLLQCHRSRQLSFSGHAQ